MRATAHTALHSGAAHRHGNIRVARGDRAPAVFREKLRVAGRIPPPELTLGARDEPPQGDSTQVTCSATAEPHPGLRRAIRRPPNPLSHQRFDRCPVFPCKPVRKLPEYDTVKLTVHDRGIVRVTIEVGLARSRRLRAFLSGLSCSRCDRRTAPSPASQRSYGACPWVWLSPAASCPVAPVCE